MPRSVLVAFILGRSASGSWNDQQRRERPRHSARRWFATLVALVVTASCAATLADGRVSRATVAVPKLGTDYFSAYTRLRSAGLAVTIPRALTFDSLDGPVLGGSLPSPGTIVRPGAVVRLRSGCCSGLGSPGVPTGALPGYRVPSFVGARAGSAAAWLRGKALYFTAHLGPLHAGRARDLYENYRVTSQQPAPGTIITLGTATSSPGGNGGSFLPTPLTIWAVQAKF